MTANNDIPEGWSKPKPPPKEPKIEWVSIEKLLDDYTIPVLAEAVEKLNVQTYAMRGGYGYLNSVTKIADQIFHLI